MANLTPKQERFVEEYLIDLNATQAAIRAGYSEKTAQEGFPNRSTVYRWLREHDEFRNNYARASDDRAESIFEEMLDIADGAEEETASIAKARLQIDARKWILSRMNPKKFSDKQTVEMTGANGGPIDMSLKVVFENDGETSTE